MIKDTVRGHRAFAAAVFVLLVAIATMAWWRIDVQKVSLIVVNESGRPIDVLWQPKVFAVVASAPQSGCEARTLGNLSPAQSWSVVRDGETIASSESEPVPWTSSRVVIEVALDAAGDIHVSPPIAMGAIPDTPIPECVTVP